MIEIIKKDWCQQAEMGLLRACGSDLAAIREQVKSGIAELWLLPLHGWLVTRVEDDELVMVAGEGRNMRDVIEVFKQIAMTNDLHNMRIHSKRAGMGRMLEPLGFVEHEKVFKAVI